MIQLHTLGALDLRRDGTEVRSVLTQPKRLALLAYLAAAWPPRFHGRDTLLGLFWPESEPERARNSLRQALHYLRRSLGSEALPGRGDWVGVDPAAVWCDATAFDQALTEDRLEDALALYRGDFLPGVFIEEAPEAERWLEEERARRRQAALRAALALSEGAEQRADVSAALAWARRATLLVPYDEAPVRRLVLLLHGLGETAGALEAAAEFARRLEADYGVRPSAELERLVAEAREEAAARGAPSSVALKAGAVPPPGPGPAAAAPADAAAKSEPAALPPTGGESPAQLYGRVFTPASAAGVRPQPGAAPRARGGTAVRRAALLLPVLLLAGAAAWFSLPRAGERAEPAPVLPTIAVLPFANLSGDPAREYFSDGITEELLNVLAQLPGLRVASRTSSFAFKDKDVGVDSIGRALRVAHVLEGSIRTAGDSVRVTAQLIDVATGYHVWSSTYDRPLADIFAVQDEISRAIVERLRVQLAPERQGVPLARTQTRDPQAHALVLQGAHIFGQNTREAYARAAEYFEQAIARDPGYARAYTSLAVTRMWQANHRYVPLEQGYEDARRLALQARRLDPQIGDPLVVLGWIRMTRDWDFTAAEALFAQAERLTPGDRRIPNYRAILLSRLERVEEAVHAAERVVAIDPTWTGGYHNLAAMYGIAGRFEQSIATYRTALELGTAPASTWVGMSMTFSLAAQHDSAIAYAQRAYRELPDDQYATAFLGFAHARAGQRAQAEARLRELEALPDVSHFLGALICAGMGDVERMFERLERAVEAREDAVPDLPADPAFRDYRQHPRMRALLQRIRTREARRG